ncbi:hypothetical protein [Pseudomonas vancouverensis]|uniref:Uncharacterized protein n=1 Tax=Pseudomonas vancouverensis TaxID=95300 RepID=A0A1H2MTM7_PSEVA|nr:hypothetical protein [Pseudomonas vancouverensis]KAB0489750.1 hypothetical protein F7R09_28975 [Pseudomonas vancouverensis]TDB67245.1 hypothetical protein EIY72_04145 [Pseudomonas vancouverensis]SDU96454.1 hypothetical protein SAMN05216558_1241 [Pseudomonas vancouverensis]
MRLIHLFAFAAPLALMLPLSAQAAWPPGLKDKYMKDCSAAASQSVNAAQAKTSCTCGADILEKKFTAQEISQLMDPNTPPTTQLAQRALKEISACKVQK